MTTPTEAAHYALAVPLVSCGAIAEETAKETAAHLALTDSTRQRVVPPRGQRCARRAQSANLVSAMPTKAFPPVQTAREACTTTTQDREGASDANRVS